MDCTIHCKECRKGTCEKAARVVSDPTFSVSLVLVGVSVTATTLAFVSACNP
jgi:hypothetical protein